MSIISNIINNCGLSKEEAQQEYESAIESAAENYVYDVAHGTSGFVALSDAVESVLSDLGVDADYEMSVACRIDRYLSEHPEIEANAKKAVQE